MTNLQCYNYRFLFKESKPDIIKKQSWMFRRKEKQTEEKLVFWKDAPKTYLKGVFHPLRLTKRSSDMQGWLWRYFHHRAMPKANLKHGVPELPSLTHVYTTALRPPPINLNYFGGVVKWENTYMDFYSGRGDAFLPLAAFLPGDLCTHPIHPTTHPLWLKTAALFLMDFPSLLLQKEKKCT